VLERRVVAQGRARMAQLFFRRVLQPIVATFAISSIAYVAWSSSPPLQAFVDARYATIFPEPTRTPLPTATPTPRPQMMPESVDPRTLTFPKGCEHSGGFNVCDGSAGMNFLARWKAAQEAPGVAGGLLGNPIGPLNRTNNTQYFEKGRMEYHAEVTDERNRVLYGLLAEMILRQLPEYTDIRQNFGGPVAPDSNKGMYVESTGHHISPEFLDVYNRFGREQWWGYPITEPYALGSVRVQWFQRARLEVNTGPGGPIGQVRVADVGSEYVTKVLNIDLYKP
jgi:hypothetical protein